MFLMKYRVIFINLLNKAAAPLNSFIMGRMKRKITVIKELFEIYRKLRLTFLTSPYSKPRTSKHSSLTFLWTAGMCEVRNPPPHRWL